MATLRRHRRTTWLGEQLEARRVLDSTVVFSEVMYHPASDDAAGEWIELHNQMSVDVELSHWQLRGAVDFEFPDATVLPAGGYLVVAATPEAVRNATSLTTVFGPWQGNLANGGERLELRNHTNRLMNSLEYSDDDPWPVGPDGSGVTLAKVDSAVDASDPSNWSPSAGRGGTPGGRNEGEPLAAGPSVRLSEVAAGHAADFFVELENTGETEVDLADMRLASNQGQQYLLPAARVAAQGRFVVSAAVLGYVPEPGDRLFLWSPEPRQLLDAVGITDTMRGRADAWDGRWQVVDAATPGSANNFDLHDEIVINEVMYHHRPTYAEAGEAISAKILSLDSPWRYHATGTDLGDAWQAENFDDSAWPSAPGLFYAESSALPGPKNTPIVLGQPTYYFRTAFELSDVSDELSLTLQHVIDDGAVFYLNGQEFHRWHLPEGNVTFNTLANASVGNAISVGPVRIPTELLRAGPNVIAVEVHQNVAASPDFVFGLEIHAAGQTTQGREFAESPEEWIELHNRSAVEIDISGWQLADGVRFEVPPQTVLAPGAYAVVASDALQLAQKHPDILILGSFTGTLSNSTERIQLLDAQQNLADEVKYYDGGYWPESADGGGSSLELRDPRADNRESTSWSASDESIRSTWKHYTYTRTVAPIVHDPPINFHEFVMGMLTAGEVLLDNISVVEDPEGTARELIQNGSFESDVPNGPAAKWRIMGTHGASQVIADAANPDNHVLQLVAEGRKHYLSNHAETTLANGARVVNGRTYQISFDAKWITGTAQLHTELYYKDAARTTILTQPTLSGTPGRLNSVARTNIGPSVTGLQHEPVVPSADQTVRVSAEAQDPDGVAGMTLYYEINGRAPFVGVPMVRDTDGTYGGLIPPQANNTVVQFYVETVDGQGAIAWYPPAGPNSSALYKVRNNFVPNSVRHDFQIIMEPDDVTRLHSAVNMLDNNRLGSTVIYDGRDVFYDTGTRLRGSMFTRNNRATTGYNVAFRPEAMFRGVHDSVAFDQNGESEIVVKFATLQSGNLGGTYDDILQLGSPSGTGGGPTVAYLARHSDLFLAEQFGAEDPGTLFEFEGIRVLTNTVDNHPESLKIYQPIGWVGNFDIQDLGDDKELYRWPFLIDGSRDRDDYSRIIEMAKAFSLTGTALEAALSEILDMDSWTHTFALMSLFGIGDAYSQGNPHNLDMYVRPSDNKVLAFPWDWDFVFSQGPTAPLHGGQNIGKILDLPQFEHLYLGQLQHLIETVFNRPYMTRWVEHFGTLLQSNLASVLTSIDNRTRHVNAQLPARVPFRLGGDEAAGDATVLIGDQAPAAALVPSAENQGDQLGTSWTLPSFVESAAWKQGVTGVGFETSPANFEPLIGLAVNEMQGKNGTVFIRVPFELGETAQLEQVMLRMKYDDGFVAYLNGVQVAAANAPANLTWDAVATATNLTANALKFADFDLSNFKHLLRPGKNLLAIHGLNRPISGTDALFVPQLSVYTVSDAPTPELVVDQSPARVEGIGWVNVKQIRLAGTNTPLPVKWLTATKWQADVPVSLGRNELTLEAIDFQGRVIGRQAINITSSAGQPVRDYLRISELMYHPGTPSAAELAAGFDDAERFEFIEVVNTAAVGNGPTLSLAGLRFDIGIEFDFSDIQLEPQQHLVIARDLDAFQFRYGDQVAAVGPFVEGRLDNAGERLRLADDQGVTILDFVYGDLGDWPVAADGAGNSLELIDPRSTSPADYGIGARWRASGQLGGSPGSSADSPASGDFNLDGLTDGQDLDLLCRGLLGQDPRFDLNRDQQVDRHDVEWMLSEVLHTTAGDANLDGTFDSRDLVLVLTAGGYEDDLVGNSSWAGGDWNCDGEFSTSDLVAAFVAGGYTTQAQAPATLRPATVDAAFAA